MSPRAALQENIVQWLRAWTTAPYGVIASLQPSPGTAKGKVRIVTFGLRRTLDATLFIWSPTFLALSTSHQSGGQPIRFTSVEAFKAHCVVEFGAPDIR